MDHFMKALLTAAQTYGDDGDNDIPVFTFAIPESDVQEMYVLRDRLFVAHASTAVYMCEVWHHMLTRYLPQHRFKEMAVNQRDALKPVIEVYSHTAVVIPSDILAIEHDHPVAGELRAVLSAIAAEPNKPTYELEYRQAKLLAACGMPSDAPKQANGLVFNDSMLFMKTKHAADAFSAAKAAARLPTTN